MSSSSDNSPNLFNLPVYDSSGLTIDQRKALDEIIKGNDIFVTGGGGTGKTYVLRKAREILSTYKKVAVVAFTAQAALEAGGMTINRFFGFPPEVCLTKGTKPRPRQLTSDLLMHTNVLIIDEISMVRSDLMDAILMSVAKAERKRGTRIQIVLFGDFFQLPPVPATSPEENALLEKHYGNRYQYRYAFMAKGWKGRGFRMIELTTVLRQNDNQFIENLNKIRKGDTSAVDWFNRNASFTVDKKAPYFYPLNESVRDINKEKIDDLSGELYVINPKPLFGADTYFEDSEAIDIMTLHLKAGCRVMATKNYIAPGVFNGMIGTVVSIDRAYSTDNPVGYSVSVKFDRLCEKTTINPIEFPVTRYEAVDSTFLQIDTPYYQLPLKLAYAMTIHKGQGKTCDAANINPHCRIPGQLYVALSRVTDISGLHMIKKIQSEYVVVSEEVKEYMKYAGKVSHVFSWEAEYEKSNKQNTRTVTYSKGITRMAVPRTLQPIVKLLIESFVDGKFDQTELNSMYQTVMIKITSTELAGEADTAGE